MNHKKKGSILAIVIIFLMLLTMFSTLTFTIISANNKSINMLIENLQEEVTASDEASIDSGE